MARQNSKSQKSKSGKPERLRLPRRRRGQGDIEPTTPKSYTLPFAAALEIQRVAPDYGSQGRALQVGSEMAFRMKNPPAVPSNGRETMIRMTYKLTPRTIRLLDKLAQRYGNAGQAICACLKTLRMKRID